MSCGFTGTGTPGQVCMEPAEWLVEGQTVAPFTFDVVSDYERRVCGEHVFVTVKEFAGEGVCPVLVSEYVEGSS